MNKQRKVFIVLLSALIFFSFIPTTSTNAEDLDSAQKRTTVYGYTYVYKSTLKVYPSFGIVQALTSVAENTGDIPTGYAGAQARLYTSNDVLFSATIMKYNEKPMRAFVVLDDEVEASGQFYSYGKLKLYSGDGYIDAYAGKTPIGTIGLFAPNYQVNDAGETYGSGVYADIMGEEPDLIKAYGVNGNIGYVRSTDLDSNPRTPVNALQQQENQEDTLTIPLYKEDGITVIDSFILEAPTVKFNNY